MTTKRLVWVGATAAAALVSAASVVSSTAPDPSRTPARVVPITEETAAPGVADGFYEPCLKLNLSEWRASIITETNECDAKTSFKWGSSSLPTDPERDELCSCTLLIDKLQTVVVPRCSLTRNGAVMPYAQLFTFAFAMCQVNGTATSTPTSTPTIAPTTSSFPPTTTDAANDDGTTTSTTSTSGSQLPLIGGISGAVVAVIIVVMAFLCWRKRKQAADGKRDGVQDTHDTVDAMPLIRSDSESPTVYLSAPKTLPVHHRNFDYLESSGGDSSLQSTASAGTQRSSEVVSAWDDPAITAVRIPYDSVFFNALISRGGYGEVHRGTYMGEQVAIKQLLPERRKDLAQIDAFVREIKMLSALNHDRIVRCIGIAWNALSDVCAVVEFLPNGDLRAMLTKWENQDARPRGFDADKAKIALHVAHALTYLHTCQPVIVHRDLKSRNIVLTENYDAKLTDFGVSRERTDSTMTPGVGTSLWMAPEVMLGERYNEKADVFSFGVVLAELDTHELPYSHAVDSVTGRRLIEPAILQLVSSGSLTIQFSEHTNREIAQLGRECVAMNATQRPTSGQVLHRVHQIQRQMFS